MCRVNFKFILFPALFFFVQTLHAQSNLRTDESRALNSRSDSVDVNEINISLNITDFIGKTISGNAVIQFHSLINGLSELDLDIYKFDIDSVLQNNAPLNFTYSDSVLLKIQLNTTMNVGDSSAVIVYYHGKPKVDMPSGWGGFYFNGPYAFNLGVGFSANPHPYGRAWFPCFDNFVERCKYEFQITCDSLKKASCNGQLVSVTNNGNGTSTYQWIMNQEIPSYLACVSVGPYAELNYFYNSIDGPINIDLFAAPADTTHLRNSFTHLGNALDAFITAWGPFRWNKVGYSLVPFSSGAMEHATNISFPQVCANGSTTYETIMAHELSHHWFGDLITCRTADDMWINEGFASYNERIFLQYTYGQQSYMNSIKANHLNVLQYTHTTDSAYLAVSGIPQNFTYGSTVYDKGADVIHTLRSYMGDTLFFSCIRSFLNSHQFEDVNSADLRDYLTTCSGMDLNSFFSDWIFNPGFPQFSLDSMMTWPANGGYDVVYYLKQKLDHAPQYYSNVPLEILFMDDNWNQQVMNVEMSGSCGIFFCHLPFDPTVSIVDPANKISDAETDDYLIIKNTGSYVFNNGKMNVAVSSLGGADSIYFHVQHNFVRPDPMKNPIPNLHLSDYRYWQVDGNFNSGFTATAVLQYNATHSTAGGWLDDGLITNTEDSLVVMYRQNVQDDWQVEPNVVQNFLGSHLDGRGYFTLNDLRKGQYTLAIYDYDKIDSAFDIVDSCIVLSALNNLQKQKDCFSIFPNPNNGKFTLQYNFDNCCDEKSLHTIKVFNSIGKQMYSGEIKSHIGSLEINATDWPEGMYFVNTNCDINLLPTQKLLIIK